MGQAIGHKLERRALRRIVGDDAPKVFADFDQRIKWLEQAQVQNVKAANERLDRHETQLNDVTEWRGRSFWGRLRWLFAGQ